MHASLKVYRTRAREDFRPVDALARDTSERLTEGKKLRPSARL